MALCQEITTKGGTMNQYDLVTESLKEYQRLIKDERKYEQKLFDVRTNKHELEMILLTAVKKNMKGEKHE